MTSFLPARLTERAADGANTNAASATFPTRVDPPNAIHARVTFTNANAVRALVLDADHDAVWAATSGGLDRYDAKTLARTHFGVETGLDSLDVRAIHVVPFLAFGALVVETAESRCVVAELNVDRFKCFSARPPAPNAPLDETLGGFSVVARVAVEGGAFVATRGAGVWFAKTGSSPSRLDETNAPRSAASFVRKLAFYKHRRWAGTFDDGLVVLDESGAHPVSAPMRMVNDLVATNDALFIAANEGFFFTRDGKTFERVDTVGRGATGVAWLGDHVFVTTTSAVWRMRLRHRGGAIVDGNWWRPAGTRSLQGIAMSETSNGTIAWMASEDRGVIRFDPSSNAPQFVSVDKLAGAPTSWVVALAGDARGGVFAATLRDGVFHVDAHGAVVNVPGVPNAWTLDASFAAGKLCVGTQAGAACWDDWTKPPSTLIVGLPDARVHDVERDGNVIFVSTEAGLAET